MSLHDKAMLVTLSLSKLGLNRKDPNEAKEVAKRHGGDAESFRVTKRLLAGNKAHKAIRTFDSSLAEYHRKHTLPWDDKGTRLLPVLSFDGHTKYIRDARATREGLVAAFITDFHAFKQADRIALGTAFSEADYPDPYQLRRAFAMDFKIDPVPDGKDFRITVSKEDMLELEKGVAARIANAEQVIKQELMGRLAEPLQKMAEKLGDPDKKFTLGTTVPLVEGLREILDMLPAMNIVGDPRIERFRQSALKLSKYEPETLKNSPVVRTVVASKAQEIVDAMSDFMGAPVVPLDACLAA
jgi:hypothetical protein